MVNPLNRPEDRDQCNSHHQEDITLLISNTSNNPHQTNSVIPTLLHRILHQVVMEDQVVRVVSLDLDGLRMPSHLLRSNGTNLNPLRPPHPIWKILNCAACE